MPSLTFCTPSTTTRSPGLTPCSTIHIGPIRSPTFTVRTLTLLSLPTTATWYMPWSSVTAFCGTSSAPGLM